MKNPNYPNAKFDHASKVIFWAWAETADSDNFTFKLFPQKNFCCDILESSRVITKFCSEEVLAPSFLGID